MDDRELLRLLAENPEAGWRQMMEQYSGLLFYLVRGKIGVLHSQEEIEDCVAESFAQAFIHWDRYDPKRSSIKTYLATIAIRKAIDVGRKGQPADSIESISMESILAPSTDLLEELIEKENRQELLNALATLTEIEKRILYLRYWENRKSKEIALELRITPATVDQRIHRLLLKLRMKIGGEYFEIASGK